MLKNQLFKKWMVAIIIQTLLLLHICGFVNILHRPDLSDYYGRTILIIFSFSVTHILTIPAVWLSYRKGKPTKIETLIVGVWIVSFLMGFIGIIAG